MPQELLSLVAFILAEPHAVEINKKTARSPNFHVVVKPNQSRTQNPQALWPAVGRQDLWRPTDGQRA